MLAKKYKLKKDNDFKRVFKEGKYFSGGFIRLKVLKNDLAIDRFGLMIGRKVSKKAVQRNRLKRQLEEIIYSQIKEIASPQSGFDVIILVDPKIIEKTYPEINQELISLLQKYGRNF